MRPVIALLTDFGTRDHYAGTMKGVALGICPDATIVDITHEIPPQDVMTGALELGASYKYFPAGTIFLAVVDPGVGSARRGIAADAGGYRFVAPDNGVLTVALKESAPKRVVELTERRYMRPTVSCTFEGRDRFAPVAAWLAKDIELTELGPTLTSWRVLSIPEPSTTVDEIVAEVLLVDRFGNLITNVDRRTFEQFAGDGPLAVTAGDHVVGTIVSTYSDAHRGSVCALFGSSDHLEVAVNGGSAAQALQLGRGARIVISRSERPDRSC